MWQVNKVLGDSCGGQPRAGPEAKMYNALSRARAERAVSHNQFAHQATGGVNVTDSCDSRFEHPCGDRALGFLSRVKGVIGEFVRVFPGTLATDDRQNWLDKWFQKRAEFFFSHSSVTPDKSLPLDDALAAAKEGQSCIVATRVKLAGVNLHYFRGFREMSDPINLGADLLVIDGRNTSGKTSLAEGIEWLLTGELCRRAMGEYGDARELENCVHNQFRPAGEQTWVEAEFVTDEGDSLKLKRVLKSDYGTTQTSCCESTLLLDGRDLTSQEETELLDNMFGGTAPMLMQHTLGAFVRSSPRNRRDYFERLLGLDELTYLIQKAVVGKARLRDFPSTTGSVALKRWQNLKSSSSRTILKRALSRVEKCDPGVMPMSIEEVLADYAASEFAEVVAPGATFDAAREAILDEQGKVRQEAFPLLAQLRPARSIDEHLLSLFTEVAIRNKLGSVRTACSRLDSAQRAASEVGDAEIAIAGAFELLGEAGLIVEGLEEQDCPLCAYSQVPTLSAARIETISSWQPIQRAVEQAQTDVRSAVGSLSRAVDSLSETRGDVVPPGPSDKEWDEALESATGLLSDAAAATREVVATATLRLKRFDSICETLPCTLEQLSVAPGALPQVEDEANELLSELSLVIEQGRQYAASVQELETAVGSLAKEDPTYSLRDTWLAAANDVDGTATDLQWEEAKRKAQAELKTIRQALMAARKELLERSRVSFSDEMTSVWRALRGDHYSGFSRLYIPEPRGRGFPVEVEVKAFLNDGTKQLEVDALRVFSESQVNVLGIAAFVTRSKQLGHRFVVLDDPVQSMDDDHFKTFASALIPQLLREGFQAIILTHNERFARELSYAHVDSPGYVTMAIHASRRKGCRVEEGSRRVAEKLKLAERKAEEGDLKRPWGLVRESLERLYTVVNIKYGCADFNPTSWRGQTADHMWKSGVGSIIEGKIPGIGRRLKEILDMTAAGAHDKPTHGPTDLANAIKDIRALLPKLQVGG